MAKAKRGHPLRFHFKCPVCNVWRASLHDESFSDFANRTFRDHTWEHLTDAEKSAIRQKHTTLGVYCQTKDGS